MKRIFPYLSSVLVFLTAVVAGQCVVRSKWVVSSMLPQLSLIWSALWTDFPPILPRLIAPAPGNVLALALALPMVVFLLLVTRPHGCQPLLRLMGGRFRQLYRRLKFPLSALFSGRRPAKAWAVIGKRGGRAAQPKVGPSAYERCRFAAVRGCSAAKTYCSLGIRRP